MAITQLPRGYHNCYSIGLDYHQVTIQQWRLEGMFDNNDKLIGTWRIKSLKPK